MSPLSCSLRIASGTSLTHSRAPRSYLNGPLGVVPYNLTADAGACAGAGGPEEGAGADGDLAGPKRSVKLFDVESTVGRGGPTDESAR